MHFTSDRKQLKQRETPSQNLQDRLVICKKLFWEIEVLNWSSPCNTNTSTAKWQMNNFILKMGLCQESQKTRDNLLWWIFTASWWCCPSSLEKSEFAKWSSLSRKQFGTRLERCLHHCRIVVLHMVCLHNWKRWLTTHSEIQLQQVYTLSSL
jgi:hypothetical protein